MQKSYIALTTINFVDFEFYIRPGDLLVHDMANHNRMTVYRNGQIIKVVKQEPLGITAFIKNHFIEEIATTAPTPVVAEVPKPLPVVEAPVVPVAPRKEFSKRDKAQPQEVPIEEYNARITPSEDDKAESNNA